MVMSQRLNRSIWLPLVLAVLMLTAAGCQAAEPTPSPAQAVATTAAVVEEAVAAYPLAATAWDLDYFGPPDAPVAVLPDTRASINYSWDRYAGYDGCNWFLGVYEANAETGELRMYTPARTMNFCDPAELSEQAGMFSSMLVNVTAYGLEGEQLAENTVDDQRLLTFSPAEVLPMPGTEWELKFWWSADVEQWAPVIIGSLTTIIFGTEGEASGSGGCNDYTVTYTGDLQIEKVMEATATYAELPTLSFGPVTSQPEECTEPEGIMDQEQGYFVQLGDVAYYFKLGGMLLMLDSEGTPLLMFAARN
jgi:heat shock protein HslJ